MTQTQRTFHGSYEKMRSYHSLCDVMAECHKCRGLNKRRGNWRDSTLAVFGSGNLDSEIMFTGQSACTRCQETGVPFTGGSGNFLDECLASINLIRRDVWITNILKCHTPNNRPSTPEEIENCRPYLEQEIRIIKPRLVVTLGRDALRCFDPSVQSVMKAAGKPFKAFGHVVYPLPHPAVPFRRPEYTSIYITEFKKILKVLEKI